MCEKEVEMRLKKCLDKFKNFTNKRRRLIMASQCDLCAYYWIDEEDGTGECQVNLDEDDLARMLSGSSDSCTKFQKDDEYKIVRKQM